MILPLADDKIIAVLENDAIYGAASDIDDIPPRLVERLVHYFGTYKMIPGGPSPAFVQAVYGVSHAEQVVLAALEDYRERFGRESDTDGALEQSPGLALSLAPNASPSPRHPGAASRRTVRGSHRSGAACSPDPGTLTLAHSEGERGQTGGPQSFHLPRGGREQGG